MENKNCNSCNYCNSCNSCNSCDCCNFCNYCINIKMTEYNYFCYNDDLNIDGFQKPRYRIFNKQLTKEEYIKIEKIYFKLEFDKNESCKTRYKTAFKKAFEKLSEEDKNKITSLPGFNQEDFKKYYGVDLTQDIEIENAIKLLTEKGKLKDGKILI